MFNLRRHLLPGLICLSLAVPTHALSLAELSNKEASSGLQAALERGAANAVLKLGKEGGFAQNERVRIALPKVLEQAAPVLKLAGQGGKLDELVGAMNSAAESAVPMAKPLLIKAVKSMTFADAKQILTGGETSVTEFFKQKTSADLSRQFLPAVKNVTGRSGLANKYNQVVGRVSQFAQVPPEQATVEAYVTQKTLDGLFYMIGEEEKAIRQDPLGSGSKVIGKVFGLLK